MHMLLLQAVTLDQQTYFWRSLLLSDIHSPPEDPMVCMAVLYIRVQQEFLKNRNQATNKPFRLKIKEQPQKHWGRH